MSREAHVRFYEGLGARFPGATHRNIYVRSRGAGQRVMTNVTRFLTRRLKLKVNEAKSAVARPEQRKFLGFSFSNNKEPKRRISPKALLRCKQKIRELTRRTRGISLEQMTKELAAHLRGWKSYFGYCQTPWILRNLASVYELAGRLSLCPNLLIVAPPRLNPKKPHSVKVLSFFLPPETRLARCLVLPRFV